MTRFDGGWRKDEAMLKMVLALLELTCVSVLIVIGLVLVICLVLGFAYRLLTDVDKKSSEREERRNTASGIVYPGRPAITPTSPKPPIMPNGPKIPMPDKKEDQ